MNTSDTNSGGWESSQMRTNICGTSLTSPSGTIIAAIPEELRAVLKPVTKYTNNIGNSTDANAVTATTDYFFLLSEYEVFGTSNYSNKTEQLYQERYAYYSAGNSVVKYKNFGDKAAVVWKLRSPSPGSKRFVVVNGSAMLVVVNAAYSQGFAPAFCV